MSESAQIELAMRDENVQSVCELIIKQACSNPARIAIIDGELEISYQRLIDRSGEIAAELIARGIKRGQLVGVCLPRNWQLMAALLGVLRAGCAYVPLDPAYPHERVSYMLKHSRVAATIVGDDKGAKLCADAGQLIHIAALSKQEIDLSLMTPSRCDLAYVIYTSGSTGKPKGVAVEHSAVLSLVQTMNNLFNQVELSGVLSSTSVCFDPSVAEIFGTLSLGGSIILAENILQLHDLPAVNRVTTYITVPSAVEALLSCESLSSRVRCIVFGGEVLKRHLVTQLFDIKDKLRVFNAYGPTEDTVFSTIKEVDNSDELITIGKPVADTRCYILDDARRPVPVGSVGELYLAGDKLAWGYLYDEARTAERFIDDELLQERLYRTGDLGRFTENGEIEFIGRADQQVKIRGFRVELEEIEAALETMIEIDAAAVTVFKAENGQQLLAAFVVSLDNSVVEDEVKTYMAHRLPHFMVPQAVVEVKSLPVLPNGKLDRNNLPNFEQLQAANLEAGQKAMQLALDTTDEGQKQKILDIVQREVAALLNFSEPSQVIPTLSLESSGLDSLVSLELSNRLSDALGRRLAAKDVIRQSTPQDLVNYIVKLVGEDEQFLAVPTNSADLDTLANFQEHIQSSHPTFQAAKAPAWDVSDKSVLLGQVMAMVNQQRRNPYSKVLRTGSGTTGIVADAHSNEQQQAIIWTTNLYLGLNRDEQVVAAARKAVDQFGTGMGTSAAASGLTDLHLQFERNFAQLVGKQGACLFPTGYTANVGVVAGLLSENDVVVIDQLCHASIVDGAHLSGSRVRTFKHNDAQDLEVVLKAEVSPYRSVLVVIEGVYSMGEGAAPMAEIVHMAKKYKALVLVDEAHSFGFYGDKGAGICAAQGVSEQVDFIMTTLSKSLGSLGGVVAACQEHVNLLKSSARAYIFQASVSPADIGAALKALERLSSDDSLRERLWDTARYMREKFFHAGFDLGTGDGPIVTPHFSDKDKLYAIVQELYKRGVQTSAVTYPIVEHGRGRLRFICSASHTKEDVDRTLDALIEAERAAQHQLMMRDDKSNQSNIDLTEVEPWLHRFADFLVQYIGGADGVAPNVHVAIANGDASQSLSLSVIEKQLFVGEQKQINTPNFSMSYTSQQGIIALTQGDVQSLLEVICDGGCVLHGQVEPFVWFMARLVQWRDW